MIRLKAVDASDILDLRRRVLRQNASDASAAVFDGDGDSTTLHFAAYDGDAVVSCVSLMKASNALFNEENQYRLRGLATDEKYRMKGYATGLVKLAEFALFAEGNTDRIWMNARVGAISFYEKLGYHTVGEVFSVEGIGEHTVMTKVRSEYKGGCCGCK